MRSRRSKKLRQWPGFREEYKTISFSASSEFFEVLCQIIDCALAYSIGEVIRESVYYVLSSQRDLGRIGDAWAQVGSYKGACNITTITLCPWLLDAIDREVESAGFGSRSEFMRYCVCAWLRALDLLFPQIRSVVVEMEAVIPGLLAFESGGGVPPRADPVIPEGPTLPARGERITMRDLSKFLRPVPGGSD